MAVAVRQQLAMGNNQNGTNCTAALGAGTTVGDVVVVIHMDDFYTAALMTAPTATNYTFVQQGSTVDMGSNQLHAKVWASPVTTGGAATVTCHSTNTDQERYMATYVLTGANSTADVVGGNGSTTSVTPFSLTAVSPTQTTDLLIGAWLGLFNSTGSYSTFTNSMTQQGTSTWLDTGNNIALACTAMKTLSASGSTGACAVTPSVSSPWVGVLVAVSASGAAPATAPFRRPRGPNYRR